MRRRRSRHHCAGFSMLEAVIAMAVVVLVAGTLLAGGPRTVGATSAALRASAAHRLATSALEDIDAPALQPGVEIVSNDSDPLLAGAEVTRTVREIEARLFEVEAVVLWNEPGEADPRRSRVVTLVAQEPIR